MKKEIKIGDVYFENEILKVTYTESYYHDKFAYLVDFLGNTCTHHCLEEHIKETIENDVKTKHNGIVKIVGRYSTEDESNLVKFIAVVTGRTFESKAIEE